MSNLRIMVIDDHLVVREGLKSLLRSQADLELVGEADDGKSAVALAKKLKPDVILMDMSMPRMNGALATRELKRVCPETKVLALSVHEEKSHVRQFFECGACGYILKRAPVTELLQAIRAVAAGGMYIDPNVAHKMVRDFARDDNLKTSAAAGALSDREETVVRLIAQGFSNQEIAEKLGLSVKTVATDKTRGTKKLDLHGRADFVRYAINQGWLQDGAVPS